MPDKDNLDIWLKPLEPFFKWLDKYAVTAMASFSVGWFLTFLSVYMDKRPMGNLINTLIAVGTLAAAIAALSTARSAGQERQRQADLEREEKRPNLILSKLELCRSLKTGRNSLGERLGPHVELSFTATNLSQRAIVIRKIMFDSDFITKIGENIPRTVNFETLIPPDASEVYYRKFNIDYDIEHEGCVVFSFQYGATGPVPHTMTWHFDLVKGNDGGEEKFVFATKPYLHEGKGYDQNVYDQSMQMP